MVRSKKQSPAEDLIESLLSDLGEAEPKAHLENEKEDLAEGLVGLVSELSDEKTQPMISVHNLDEGDYEGTRNEPETDHEPLSLFDEKVQAPIAAQVSNSEATVAIFEPNSNKKVSETRSAEPSDAERTIAVTGFQIKPEVDYNDKVKVAVGQNRPTAYSPGYASWGNNSDSNLAQAENLRMAQEKILELERESEQLRQQNEELISASEIIKERSDLLTAQVTEFKRDRDGLEESFKNEMTLLKNHLTRKEAELHRAQFKVDELESRLKFDMKKIRIRERELENRLELVRAEKNAIVRNKDEQILDLRRKMDIVQMEVDSYRQKCVELNKLVEINQDSFKRTTRALRLAMANLELQDENKVPLKKVD